MKRPLIVGDLLYHCVHGICRLNEIVKVSKEATYTLSPQFPNRMKLRFTLAEKDLGISGFHLLISEDETNQLFNYLRTSLTAGTPLDDEKKAGRSFAEDNTTWALAQTILTCSQDDALAKDQRKRQTLQRAATGLVRELAFVLKLPLKETAEKVRKSLARTSRINPLVNAALENVAEDY